MRLKPQAEVITGDLNGLVSLVPRVDLGMDDMGLGQGFFQKLVYMSGKRAER